MLVALMLPERNVAAEFRIRQREEAVRILCHCHDLRFKRPVSEVICAGGCKDKEILWAIPLRFGKARHVAAI